MGSKSQRGLTQMALDVLFQSIGTNLVHPTCTATVFPSISAADVSEAQMLPASIFLDSINGDNQSERGGNSRAQTPMLVGDRTSSRLTNSHPTSEGLCSRLLSNSNMYHPECRPSTGSHPSRGKDTSTTSTKPVTKGFARIARSVAKVKRAYIKEGGSLLVSTSHSKRPVPRLSAMPHVPSVDDLRVPVDRNAEYAIVISTYEVYNDRIFDLLGGTSMSGKGGTQRRRALLFKNTEMSPEKKAVAGLRKIVCGSLEEALMVLETGLLERKVAGTGSNAVSSRSHGFFCVEVKKRNRVTQDGWHSSALTIVDLAGESTLITG